MSCTLGSTSAYLNARRCARLAAALILRLEPQPGSADELEEDYLDKAWGLEPESRLSCQAQVSDTNLVVEIPRYTINHASERH